MMISYVLELLVELPEGIACPYLLDLGRSPARGVSVYVQEVPGLALNLVE
jgi:hypothetical protein